MSLFTKIWLWWNARRLRRMMREVERLREEMFS